MAWCSCLGISCPAHSPYPFNAIHCRRLNTSIFDIFGGAGPISLEREKAEKKLTPEQVPVPLTHGMEIINAP